MGSKDQLVMVLASKPDVPSSIPGTHLVEKRIDTWELSSDLHIYTRSVAPVYSPCTYKMNPFEILKTLAREFGLSWWLRSRTLVLGDWARRIASLWIFEARLGQRVGTGLKLCPSNKEILEDSSRCRDQWRHDTWQGEATLPTGYFRQFETMRVTAFGERTPEDMQCELPREEEPGLAWWLWEQSGYRVGIDSPHTMGGRKDNTAIGMN